MGATEVPCPRCHQTCGWCGDYRHMHGTLKLPGYGRRCTLPFDPEGADCSVCQGDMRVRAVTTYERLAERDSDGTATAAINEDLSVPKDCQARAVRHRTTGDAQRPPQ